MATRPLNDGDPIPGIELTQWRVGRVLTAEDIEMLQLYLRMVDEDEDRMLGAYQNAREHALRDLGGQALVDAFQADDEHAGAKAVQGALAAYYAKLAAQKAAAQ